MTESAEWLAYRQGASLDSSGLREKGVTPAWTIGGEPRGKAYLLGDRKSTETFSPERPPHARNETPYSVAQMSSIGVQVQSESNGRLESAPAFNFYGPYSDAWSQDCIDQLKGDRVSKEHGLFAADNVAASNGVGGVTVRAPPKVPGPGHYITSSDQAHVQACGPQVLSTQTSLRQVGLSAPSSLSEQEAARLAAYAVTCAPKKGGTFDWPDRGPVATTSRGAKVTNASIGVRQPSSTLRNASAFTFTERAKPSYNSNPGPGGGGVRAVEGAVISYVSEGRPHVIDAFTKVNGAPHVVTDTTLSRVATRPNAPVATMANREPRHPRKPPKDPEVASAKEDYRSHPDRWSTRVSYQLSNEPTEARSAVYSSFGGQLGSVKRSAAAYTMRGLDVNQRKQPT